MINYSNKVLVGEKRLFCVYFCVIIRSNLKYPKKTRLSLCYVKKKLYFCTRKINGKRVRGSKNRQKRDFDLKKQPRN